MKNAQTELRSALLQLLRMDYGVELYNWNENILRVSFYRLSSVYNGFCTTFTFRGDWTEPEVNWQYSAPNKKAEKLVKRATSAALQIFKKRGSWDQVEQEFDYYKPLFNAVFKAKYSIPVELHTEGVNS